jgi:hypothetical protein
MTFHFKQNPDGTYTYQGVRGKPKRIRSPFMRVLINLLITLVLGAIVFYFKLPALNLQAVEFYVFLLFLCVVFTVLTVLTGGLRASDAGGYLRTVRKHAAVPFYIALALIAVMLVGSVAGWVVLRAQDYAALLPLETGDFTEEVAEISFDQIPMLDSRSAGTLADRKLGELSELVSQFTVNDASAQINYRNRPVRVSYLDYGDIIKWWNNRSSGIPAYMIIDMVTQEVTVERVEDGIRYSPSEYFSRDITRYLRFRYPTKIFEDINFEINDDDTPYWIATVVKKTIGLFSGTDVAGIVMVNAVTGDHEYYPIEEVPTWVDRAYTASLIIQQYDYYGRYHNGFFNSIFGQRDCTETTDGYNYIAMDDDVWLYTGITSVSADRGNVGFILVNQRTKEARYYSCAGAEEYSAMSSAQGAVQQYSYQATFPLLLNISGQPTYFMALKDASSLVKMYAMVNVQQYQIVATGYSVSECAANYETMLLERDLVTQEDIHFDMGASEGQTASGVIADIRQAVIDGNTCFYIRLAGDELYYVVSAASDPTVVILDIGDRIELRYPEDAIAGGIVSAGIVQED